MPARRAVFDPATLAFLALLAGLVAVRIYALRASPLDLYFDEAQYWAWSRTLELGYFSKPPLIAWTIAGVTGLVGDDSEWAVRLAAPIGHGIAATALFMLGRTLYGSWAGFWAGLSWLVMPAVWLSSGVISTDSLLLPIWSLALLVLWRLAASRGWIWAILLGLLIGLGVLAKYAMLYFPLCMLLAAWWSRQVRSVVFGPRGVVVAVLALAAIAPNLYWNFTHGFATFTHTASNASLGEDLVNFDEALQFLLAQTSIIGPLLFIALLGLFGRAIGRAASLGDEDRFLLAFILPPLLIILVQAFLSRADAHWAATAYPAAIVWLCGSFISGKRGRRFLAAAALVNTLLGGAIALTVVHPPLADRFPTAANSIKRLRAWDETARQIALRALTAPGEAPFTAVLVDDRETFYQLVYQWRHARRAGEPLPPVRMWVLHAEPRNSAEMSNAMRAEESARVLVVHANPRYLPLVAGDFTVFRRVEHLSIDRGAAAPRELEISVAEGFAPAPRDEAYESRIPR